MSSPKLRAPVVLVHGVLGYSQIRVMGYTVARYFPYIPEYLTASGNRVLVAHLSPTRGVSDRAQQLKEFILRESPHEPVHIFGHSMGGLDSRYMISRLGMADHVLTLTTIATPHRGTTFADWAIYRLERILRPAFDSLGIPRQAFYDLTTRSCRAFNERVPDMPQVRYFSIAARLDNIWLAPEWQLPFRIVHRNEGPNDGVVSVASSIWGERHSVWDGDHLSIVNWWNPSSQLRGGWRDRSPLYGEIVRALADEGY